MVSVLLFIENNTKYGNQISNQLAQTVAVLRKNSVLRMEISHNILSFHYVYSFSQKFFFTIRLYERCSKSFANAWFP